MGGSGTFGVALVGCGVVGGAVAERLINDRKLFQEKSGSSISLKYVVSRTYKTAKALGLDSSLFERDLQVVLEDPEVACVVELVGGVTVAREVIERSLSAGKHVVTANKLLLAESCNDLSRLASENGVTLAFEASCAGGIPIIRALYDGLMANRIDALYGIVNGTCNYILSEMAHGGVDYNTALENAQREGFAELDPTMDVSGADSLHKLIILSTFAFGQRFDPSHISIEGIDGLHQTDIFFGRELGYVVKLLAVAQRRSKGLSLRVRPAFITEEHPLAWIRGPFNAVSIYGSSVGHTMYYGRGAGGAPTASAVMADIISIATGAYQVQFEMLSAYPSRATKVELLPVEEIRSRYYLRTMVQDHPGVIAQIASILSEEEISIASMLQKEVEDYDSSDNGVPVVITVHSCMEGMMRRAIARINAMDGVLAPLVCLNIVDEHPENLFTNGSTGVDGEG